jgi:hypothetical protein
MYVCSEHKYNNNKNINELLRVFANSIDLLQATTEIHNKYMDIRIKESTKMMMMMTMITIIITHEYKFLNKIGLGNGCAQYGQASVLNIH